VLCQFSAWAEAAENAARHYRASGWSPSTCLGELAAALYNGPMPVVAAIGRCEEILDEPELERGGQATTMTMLGGLESMLGRFDRGRELVRQARQIYEELGREAQASSTCQWIAGDIELLAGDPVEAAGLYGAACTFFEEAGHHMYLATLGGELAEALYMQGEYSEAEQWTRISEAKAATDDVSAQFSWRSVRAKIMARRGEAAEAEALARAAVRLAGETDGLNWRAKVALDLAEVLRLDRRLDEASAYVSEALELFDQKGNVVGAQRAESLRAELAIV
jgi:tetratricopeptide (TPR) repeat protein